MVSLGFSLLIVPGLFGHHPLPTHTPRVTGLMAPIAFFWQMWKRRSDPVLHIDLRRWADLMLVAPLDANTLGKVASGICDNLLVSDSQCLSSPALFPVY